MDKKILIICTIIISASLLISSVLISNKIERAGKNISHGIISAANSID